MSYNSLLNLKCTIQSKTVTYSDTRAATITWANKATKQKCSIQPMQGNYNLNQSGEDLVMTHIGFFKIGANIIEGDKVIESDTSKEYIVKKVFDAAGRLHHKEVGLEIST